jgi:hypothetical protein
MMCMYCYSNDMEYHSAGVLRCDNCGKVQSGIFEPPNGDVGPCRNCQNREIIMVHLLNSDGMLFALCYRCYSSIMQLPMTDKRKLAKRST